MTVDIEKISQQIECEIITKALEKTEYVVGDAASLLNVNNRLLLAKMKLYKL